MKAGDLAGLALLNLPYAWLGISKNKSSVVLQQFDQQANTPVTRPIETARVWLRVHCNFDFNKAQFSYSTGGADYENIGDSVTMPYQLKTFQGVRVALFNFNTTGATGGFADFNDFIVDEPRSKGLTRPIPDGQVITLMSLADSTVLVNWKGYVRPVVATDGFAQGTNTYFRVLDRGRGRVALQSVADSGFVRVKGTGGMAEVRIEKTEQGDASLFQWIDMLRGDLMLMSLATHRYLFVDPNAKSLAAANAPGTRPDRKDGSCFIWKIVGD